MQLIVGPGGSALGHGEILGLVEVPRFHLVSNVIGQFVHWRRVDLLPVQIFVDSLQAQIGVVILRILVESAGLKFALGACKSPVDLLGMKLDREVHYQTEYGDQCD